MEKAMAPNVVRQVNKIRTWTISIGATTPGAVGVNRSDFERGFIRCETYAPEDLETYRIEKEIHDAGKFIEAGKASVMRDGDICHFLFKV